MVQAGRGCRGAGGRARALLCPHRAGDRPTLRAAGHFILQAECSAAQTAAQAGAACGRLTHARPVPDAHAARLRPPAFRLAGLAIGNGLTDPASQARRRAYPTLS